MKTTIAKIVVCLGVAVSLQYTAWSVDCPGFCIQCKNDALSLCGAGCIQSYSCSLSTCTCGFSSRSGCHPSSPTPDALMRDSLDLSKLNLASWKDSGSRYSTPNVHFDVVGQPEVALSVTGLAIRNDSGRQVSELTYTVKNMTGFRLREISIMVVFFSEVNEPLGAEILTETLNLSPNGERPLRISLRQYVDSGQRVSLAFTSFKTDAQSWAGEHAPLINAMKHPH
jgi:hypothetical protein